MIPLVCKEWADVSALPSELWRQVRAAQAHPHMITLATPPVPILMPVLILIPARITCRACVVGRCKASA